MPPVHSSEVDRLNFFDSSDLHPTRDHDTNDTVVSAHFAQQVATSPPSQTFVGIPRSKYLASPNLWGVQTFKPHFPFFFPAVNWIIEIIGISHFWINKILRAPSLPLDPWLRRWQVKVLQRAVNTTRPGEFLYLEVIRNKWGMIGSPLRGEAPHL